MAKNNFVKLCSYWSPDAVRELVKNGVIRADGGKRLPDNPDWGEEYRPAYDFIAEHTPNVPKGEYPMWAWMTKAHNDEEDAILVEYTKKKEECLCTDVYLYDGFFGFNTAIFTDEEYATMGEDAIEAMEAAMSPEEIKKTWKKCFVHDWYKRTRTQVTFYELRLEEVTNLEEIKSQLKKLG